MLHLTTMRSSLRSFLVNILVCLVSLTTLWSFSFGVYFMVTFSSRKQCMVCKETDDEYSWFAPLIWYSDWALLSSTITWCAWVWKEKVLTTTNHDEEQQQPQQEEEEEDSSLFLIELSLPLSIFAMIGYSTVYLGTSNWGSDFVDQEACHSLVDSATPKNGIEDGISTSARFYLVAGNLTTLQVHYVYPVSNIVLYFKYYTRNKAPWKPYQPIGFIIVLSVFVVLAQEVGGVMIYCTNSIYITALYAILCCTFFHALFFFPHSRVICRRKRENKDGVYCMTAPTAAPDELHVETAPSAESVVISFPLLELKE